MFFYDSAGSVPIMLLLSSSARVWEPIRGCVTKHRYRYLGQSHSKKTMAVDKAAHIWAMVNGKAVIYLQKIAHVQKYRIVQPEQSDIIYYI